MDQIQARTSLQLLGQKQLYQRVILGLWGAHGTALSHSARRQLSDPARVLPRVVEYLLNKHHIDGGWGDLSPTQPVTALEASQFHQEL